MLAATDGLLIWPYTQHDWIILLLAMCGYFYRMLLWKKTPDVPNPSLRDWASTAAITSMLTVGLYELAIHKAWPLPIFFLPFGVSIILVKDLSDWLFLSREGKRFVLTMFKEILVSVLGKFGFSRDQK